MIGAAVEVLERFKEKVEFREGSCNYLTHPSAYKERNE